MVSSIDNDINYFQLKIAIDNIYPEIWRRVAVPDDLSLDSLHFVIQRLFSWDNSHLYRFEKAGKQYMEYLEPPVIALPSYDYTIRDLLKRKGSKIKYIYDFGDDWYHTIILENSHYMPKIDSWDGAMIRCLEGAMAGPPEDVGGPSGYDYFLRAAESYMHGGDEEMSSFYESFYDGQEFNKDEFDIEKINLELKKLYKSK